MANIVSVVETKMRSHEHNTHNTDCVAKVFSNIYIFPVIKIIPLGKR